MLIKWHERCTPNKMRFPYTHPHTIHPHPHTRHTTPYTHTHTPYTYTHTPGIPHPHTIHLHPHTRHTTDTTDTHCHLKQPTTSTRQCKHLSVWNRALRFQLPVPGSSHGHQFIVHVRNFNSTSKLSRRGHC